MGKMNEILLNEIQEFGGGSLSLCDKHLDAEGYEIAIRRARNDLTARTLTPTGKQGALIDALLDKKKEDSLLQRVAAFFGDRPKEKEAFDEWHAKTCEQVLETIREYYTNKNGTPVCFGKAQKIVNMTLKGCYCLDGARDMEDHFTHCHVALDSFTLAWYNRNKPPKKTTTAWSNLGPEEYKEIQDAIRNFEPDIDALRDMTPLQKEFLIWRLEIMINTVKEVTKCFGGIIEGDHVEEYFKKYRMANDLTMANLILGRIDPKTLDEKFFKFLEKIPENQRGKRETADFLRAKYRK